MNTASLNVASLSRAERLILVLDYPSMDQAARLVETLGDRISFYKVGLEIFLNTRGEILDYLRKKGKRIFLDLKFHDIPNTVARASLFASNAGVSLFNIHLSGGREMVRRALAAKAVAASSPENRNTRTPGTEPALIGVTVLTSLSREDLSETWQTSRSPREMVLRLAEMGREEGLNGIVCSPLEAESVKERCGSSFLTVCPGIRFSDSVSDDQKRTLDPQEAFRRGCDFLVIGRPITKAPSPKEAAERLLESAEAL